MESTESSYSTQTLQVAENNWPESLEKSESSYSSQTLQIAQDFLYQRLIKSRSFNLSDTDPEPLLTVQIPGCALRPIHIPVITTTASTLIKISRFSVKHRYIPSYRIYTRPLSFLSSQGGICYCYLLLLNLNIIMRVIASIM